MEKISQVDKATAHVYSYDDGLARIHVVAEGKASSSGWSNIRLSPTYYIKPPPNGIWEFSMIGDRPSGQVLTVMTPVVTAGCFAVPDWMKGISVNGVNATLSNEKLSSAKNNLIPTIRASLAQSGHVIIRHDIASFDDSFNPIGMCSMVSIRMKKLRHTLTLVVEGPDENKIRQCIEQAAGIGLVAAIIAVYATGGGALGAATSAFLSSLQDCLGDSFTVRIDDDSYWIEWCT